MTLSRRGRLFLCIAGVACLVVGLFPRSSDFHKHSQSWNTCTLSSEAAFWLGLASSPAYRSTRRVSKVVEVGGAVSRHNESSTSRVEFVSWSAALVVAGAVLLLVSLRSRTRAGRPG